MTGGTILSIVQCAPCPPFGALPPPALRHRRCDRVRYRSPRVRPVAIRREPRIRPRSDRSGGRLSRQLHRGYRANAGRLPLVGYAPRPRALRRREHHGVHAAKHFRPPGLHNQRAQRRHPGSVVDFYRSRARRSRRQHDSPHCRRSDSGHDDVEGGARPWRARVGVGTLWCPGGRWDTVCTGAALRAIHVRSCRRPARPHVDGRTRRTRVVCRGRQCAGRVAPSARPTGVRCGARQYQRPLARGARRGAAARHQRSAQRSPAHGGQYGGWQCACAGVGDHDGFRRRCLDGDRYPRRAPLEWSSAE